ncbi:MAG: 6-carboxytetrahydropterin synthase [Lentisphaeria bacterium]|nr:6-carboxytetrahydropterin synthase [Lentisphaeria bacterium]
MLELIFRRRYSMAHRLISGCSPKCATPHGHNEYVEVVIRPKDLKPLDQNANMVEVFEKAKKRWHQWIDNMVDHAFQLNDTDPIITFFKEQETEKLNRIMITPGDPTTEMLSVLFMAKLTAFLEDAGGKLYVESIKIEETPTNTTRITGRDCWKRHLSEEIQHWWNRADDSINDLN